MRFIYIGNGLFGTSRKRHQRIQNLLCLTPQPYHRAVFLIHRHLHYHFSVFYRFIVTVITQFHTHEKIKRIYALRNHMVGMQICIFRIIVTFKGFIITSEYIVKHRIR